MGRLRFGRRKPAQLRWAADQGKQAVTTQRPGRTTAMDKTGGYTGSLPASEVGPPAPLPSETIRPYRPGDAPIEVIPGGFRTGVSTEPTSVREAFEDDSENTGPIPILGRDFLAGDPTRRVLAEVAAERRAQDARWGEQNHPDGTHLRWSNLRDTTRSLTDQHAADGDVTWLDIALEEVYEAAAEEDTSKLRVELVQAAAVFTAWVEAIDRRTS
jgi:hypothetical protein